MYSRCHLYSLSSPKVGMVRVWSREGHLGWIPTAITCYLMTTGKLTFWFTVSLFIKSRLSLPSRVVVRTQYDKTYNPWSIYFILMLPYGGTLGCSPCLTQTGEERPISSVSVGEESELSPFPFLELTCLPVTRYKGPSESSCAKDWEGKSLI